MEGSNKNVFSGGQRKRLVSGSLFLQACRKDIETISILRERQTLCFSLGRVWEGAKLPRGNDYGLCLKQPQTDGDDNSSIWVGSKLKLIWLRKKLKKVTFWHCCFIYKKTHTYLKIFSWKSDLYPPNL